MTSSVQRRGLFDVWGERVFLGMVGLVPLFFALHLHDTFDLPKLTLVYLTVLILLMLWGLQAAQTGVLILRRTPLDLPLIGFLAAAALSCLRSIDPASSLYGAYRIYVFGLFPMTAFALLYWLAAQLPSEALRVKIIWVVVGSGALVGFYAVLQYCGFEMFDLMPKVVGGRPWSSMGNPLYMGAICMMATALGTALFLDPTLSRFPRIALSIMLGCNLIGLWLSLSRSAWTGFLVALGVIVYATGRLHSKKLLSMGILVAAIAGAGFLGSSAFRARAATLLTLHDASNAARVEGWKAGLRVWEASPFLGTGPDTFFEAFRTYRSYAYLRAAGPSVTQADAHNDFIQILSTMGVLGFAFFLYVLCRFVKGIIGLLRNSKQRDPLFLIRLGMAAALIGLLVQDQFNFSSVATSAWAAALAGLLWPRQTEKSIRMATVYRSAASRLLWIAGLSVMGYFCIRPVLADAVFQKGIQEAAMGHLLQSLDDHREAVRLNPGVETYPSELANRCRQIAQLSVEGPLRNALFDEAWAAAQSVPRRHPWDPDAWNNQGVAAMWLTQMAGRPLMPEARDAFETAVQRDPVFVDAWANLAKWQHLNGNIDEEKRLWKVVLTMDPSHPMAKQVLQIAL